MIYVLATMRIVQANVEEFKKVFEDEGLPLGAKHGRKLVGQWETSIGPIIPRELIDLWAYEDLAHRQKCQEAMAKDEEFQKFLVKINSLILEETIKIIAPTPCSPLQ